MSTGDVVLDQVLHELKAVVAILCRAILSRLARPFHRKYRTFPRCPCLDAGMQCSLPDGHREHHRFDVDNTGFTNRRRWRARVSIPRPQSGDIGGNR